MTREEAHKLVDALFDSDHSTSEPVEAEVVEELKKELPKDKRVVRTKTSGDRVYLLDEVKKTRQWITNPEVLAGYGFKMEDVVEVTDEELFKYKMEAAIYRVDS